ncbi:hypothetical protein HanIR_Chr13g0621331 [Helianthus annuus]|nr:hypothetical protein HanIR_Chr13g0621331 [Helianthus annuus]
MLYVATPFYSSLCIGSAFHAISVSRLLYYKQKGIWNRVSQRKQPLYLISR